MAGGAAKGRRQVKCQFAKIGTACICEECVVDALIAAELVDRGVLLTAVPAQMRPWMLKVREERSRIRSPGAGGVAGPVDDDGGPWHENAVGELEDYDDGTETK